MQFGSHDFVKLFNDFGKPSSNVAFNLYPAVRHPTGPCIDENDCDYEKATLCAFQVRATPFIFIAFTFLTSDLHLVHRAQPRRQR